MKRYVLVVLIIALFVLRGHCQENQVSNNQDASQVASETAPPVQTKSDEIVTSQEVSIYGEIKSVDAVANSIVVQYYDYDSDNEKSVDITADSNTKIDGALTINDIKQGNWVDVNYAVINCKNMAKLIAVEKEEDSDSKESTS